MRLEYNMETPNDDEAELLEPIAAFITDIRGVLEEQVQENSHREPLRLEQSDHQICPHQMRTVANDSNLLDTIV
jgi:hypothetical protein